MLIDGNLLSKTDANNVTMSYSYDALNRLTNQSASNGSVNDTYIYDVSAYSPNQIGRLFGTRHGAGDLVGTDFYYDAMGHNTATIYSDPSTSVWSVGMQVIYDLAGQPNELYYPGNLTLLNNYDAGGRLTTVTDFTDGITGTSYFAPTPGQDQYTAAGALAAATYGNGVTENITYNSRLQPCHTMANSPAVSVPVYTGGGGGLSGPIYGGGNVYDRTSSYANDLLSSSACNPEPGNNGNIGSIADNVNAGWSQTFAYDGLNRLTSAARSDAGYNHTYNYDSFGNLLVHDNLNTNPSYDINPATNQLNRWNGVVNMYSYDAAGSLLSSGTSDIGGHSFTYNALSQITTVDSGATASYLYNGNDERVYKTTASGWTDYVYFGGQPFSELDSTGTRTNYIYANGRVAQV